MPTLEDLQNDSGISKPWALYHVARTKYPDDKFFLNDFMDLYAHCPDRHEVFQYLWDLLSPNPAKVIMDIKESRSSDIEYLYHLYQKFALLPYAHRMQFITHLISKKPLKYDTLPIEGLAHIPDVKSVYHYLGNYLGHEFVKHEVDIL